MNIVTSIIRVGGSVTMVIPPIVLKEMEIIPCEKLIIKYSKSEMNITKLKDIVAVWNKSKEGDKDE